MQYLAWPRRPPEVQHLNPLAVMGLDVLSKKPQFSEGWAQKKDGHLILRAKHSNSEELMFCLTLPKEMWKQGKTERKERLF